MANANANVGDGVEVLQNHVPEDPSDEDVRSYAEYIGIEPDKEQHLMWIARKGIVAPVPSPWKACVQDTADGGEIFYFNFETGESSWDHPCDAMYRNMVIEKRRDHEMIAPERHAFVNKDDEAAAGSESSAPKKENPKPVAALLGAVPIPGRTLRSDSDEEKDPGRAGLREGNSDAGAAGDAGDSHGDPAPTPAPVGDSAPPAAQQEPEQAPQPPSIEGDSIRTELQESEPSATAPLAEGDSSRADQEASELSATAPLAQGDSSRADQEASELSAAAPLTEGDSSRADQEASDLVKSFSGLPDGAEDSDAEDEEPPRPLGITPLETRQQQQQQEQREDSFKPAAMRRPSDVVLAERVMEKELKARRQKFLDEEPEDNDPNQRMPIQCLGGRERSFRNDDECVPRNEEDVGLLRCTTPSCTAASSAGEREAKEATSSAQCSREEFSKKAEAVAGSSASEPRKGAKPQALSPLASPVAHRGVGLGASPGASSASISPSKGLAGVGLAPAGLAAELAAAGAAAEESMTSDAGHDCSLSASESVSQSQSASHSASQSRSAERTRNRPGPLGLIANLRGSAGRGDSKETATAPGAAEKPDVADQSGKLGSSCNSEISEDLVSESDMASPRSGNAGHRLSESLDYSATNTFSATNTDALLDGTLTGPGQSAAERLEAGSNSAKARKESADSRGSSKGSATTAPSPHPTPNTQPQRWQRVESKLAHLSQALAKLRLLREAQKECMLLVQQAVDAVEGS